MLSCFVRPHEGEAKCSPNTHTHRIKLAFVLNKSAVRAYIGHGNSRREEGSINAASSGAVL